MWDVRRGPLVPNGLLGDLDEDFLVFLDALFELGRKQADVRVASGSGVYAELQPPVDSSSRRSLPPSTLR